MTKEEALHKLEFMRNAYQKLIDENVDEGRFVGTDVTGTWKADTPLNKVYAEHVEALDMAISALEEKERNKVRCDECKHKRGGSGFYECSLHGWRVKRFDSCGDGERRNET